MWQTVLSELASNFYLLESSCRILRKGAGCTFKIVFHAFLSPRGLKSAATPSLNKIFFTSIL